MGFAEDLKQKLKSDHDKSDKIFEAAMSIALTGKSQSIWNLKPDLLWYLLFFRVFADPLFPRRPFSVFQDVSN